MTKVLVVEDEARIAAVLSEGLQAEGYVVAVASDGEEGIRLSQDSEVELVILDVMLPKADGYQVLATIRAARPQLPVLMLTALGDLRSRVGGLDAGADDYLTKPFALEELLARVRALSRRRDQAVTLVASGVTLDLRTRTTRVRGTEVELTEREFLLLECLMSHSNQLVTRAYILHDVWQIDFDPLSTVLETTINRLRRKIDPAGGPSLIETVRGSGYRFIGQG